MGDASGGRNGIHSSAPKIISSQVVIKDKELWGQQPGCNAALGKEVWGWIVNLSEVSWT